MLTKSGHTRVWPPPAAYNGIADKCVVVAGEKLLAIDGRANAPNAILAVARSAVCAIELLSQLHNGFGIVHIYWRGCGECWCAGCSLRCKITLDVGHNLLNLPRFEHGAPAGHRGSRHTIPNRAGQHFVLFVLHIGGIQGNPNIGATAPFPVARSAVGQEDFAFASGGFFLPRFHCGSSSRDVGGPGCFCCVGRVGRVGRWRALRGWFRLIHRRFRLVRCAGRVGWRGGFCGWLRLTYRPILWWLGHNAASEKHASRQKCNKQQHAKCHNNLLDYFNCSIGS